MSWLRFPAGIRRFAAGIQYARVGQPRDLVAHRLCWPIRLLGFKRSHSNPCAVKTKKTITCNLPVTHLAQSRTASLKRPLLPPALQTQE